MINNVNKIVVILTLAFILFSSLDLSAQFRMVSNGNPVWTTVNDSTYTANINLQSDLTGQSYTATQVSVGYRIFSTREQVYRISNINGSTFSSVDVTIVEVDNDYVNTEGSPAGQVMVYNPSGKETVPDAPFGSTGATAVLNAAVVTYNAKIDAIGGGSDPQPNYFYYESNTAGDDYSLPLDTLLKYDHLTISVRVATGNANVITLPDLNSSSTIHNGKTIIVHATGQEATPGTLIVEANGTSTIRSTYCYSNGTDVQPDTIPVPTGDDKFVIYRTNEKDDYFRNCTQGIVSGTNYVAPGDTIPAAGVEMTYESITVGGATLNIGYINGDVSFTNPSSGKYDIVPSNGADVIFANIVGDDGTLNASSEMIITFDNTTNNTPRRFNVQSYDNNNDAYANSASLPGTNWNQSVTGNVTTITMPGLNGFGSPGYTIQLR